MQRTGREGRERQSRQSRNRSLSTDGRGRATSTSTQLPFDGINNEAGILMKVSPISLYNLSYNELDESTTNHRYRRRTNLPHPGSPPPLISPSDLAEMSPKEIQQIYAGCYPDIAPPCIPEKTLAWMNPQQIERKCRSYYQSQSKDRRSDISVSTDGRGRPTSTSTQLPLDGINNDPRILTSVSPVTPCSVRATSISTQSPFHGINKDADILMNVSPVTPPERIVRLDQHSNNELDESRSLPPFISPSDLAEMSPAEIQQYYADYYPHVSPPFILEKTLAWMNAQDVERMCRSYYKS